MIHKILIAEDEYSIREMYKLKLQNSGYDVKTAEDGSVALKIAKDWLPDLILLDLRMPKISGDKALQTLRSNDWGANIKVIILTNISKSEAPSSLRFLNVERYIIKAHTTPSEITKHIKEVLI